MYMQQMRDKYGSLAEMCMLDADNAVDRTLMQDAQAHQPARIYNCLSYPAVLSVTSNGCRRMKITHPSAICGVGQEGCDLLQQKGTSKLLAIVQYLQRQGPQQPDCMHAIQSPEQWTCSLAIFALLQLCTPLQCSAGRGCGMLQVNITA